MLLMIDNYDSFTYNLVQYLGELGAEVEVYRNDQITIEQIEAKNPDHLMVSPGPCTPNEAGISLAAIEHFKGKLPILGVCLGHQSIGQVFGGRVVGAVRIMHGKTSMIHHNGEDIFLGLPSPFEATRYHSLMVDTKSVPDCLEVVAHSEENELMALRHRAHPTWGVQFHPESILTREGQNLLKNFLDRCD